MRVTKYTRPMIVDRSAPMVHFPAVSSTLHGRNQPSWGSRLNNFRLQEKNIKLYIRSYLFILKAHDITYSPQNCFHLSSDISRAANSGAVVARAGARQQRTECAPLTLIIREQGQASRTGRDWTCIQRSRATLYLRETSGTFLCFYYFLLLKETTYQDTQG